MVYILSQGLFGNGVGGGGGESPLGGLGVVGSKSSGSVMSSSARQQMLQAQPSLRDPSRGAVCTTRLIIAVQCRNAVT